MGSFDKDRFRRTVRFGHESDIQKEAKEMFERSWDKRQAAEDIAEVLKEERPWETREFANEVAFDGIRVKKGTFPKVEITEDDC